MLDRGSPVLLCHPTPPHTPLPLPPISLPPSILQCKDVLPTEMLEDGSAPAKKWNHYQHWWQTVMTKIAPELRSMGWGNLK